MTMKLKAPNKLQDQDPAHNKVTLLYNNATKSHVQHTAVNVFQIILL